MRAAFPFLDLKAQYAGIRREVLEAVTGVFDSQHFILGPEVEALEKEMRADDRVQSRNRLRLRIGCVDSGVAGLGNWARR